ncbi:unnamed protein product [Gordionus sp. m RMFG-2023]
MAATGTELGKKVKGIMDKGELVSNDVMFAILEKKLLSPECKHGVIFDGFPRNIAQAQELDKMMTKLQKKLSCVIEFKVPDENLIGRITGRLIHEPSGRTYHIKNNPPKVPMKDDVTGEPLIQRPDDNVKVLEERLKVYHSQTKPLIEFYSNPAHKGLLKVVIASKPLDQVFKDVEDILKSLP